MSKVGLCFTNKPNISGHRKTQLITTTLNKITCAHCGEECQGTPIALDALHFCCTGCKSVYELLAEHNLCQYYSLDEKAVGNKLKPLVKGKYDYLNDEEMANKIIQFKSLNLVLVQFYVPKIHCSSCIWLIEKLYHLDKGIIDSKVNFNQKTIQVKYNPNETNLKRVVEILAQIGYEPEISLSSISGRPEKNESRARIIKLGVAGFCFGNIMLLSFPDYFAGTFLDPHLHDVPFRIIALILSLPVFFYSASEFYLPAWKSLKKGYLSIDAPVFLAVLVTFLRSVYEIGADLSGGYLDSMSGIVFFMLLGRVFQDLTHQYISFNKTLNSFIPLAISKKTGLHYSYTPVTKLEKNDVILVRNEEIIPCDGLILSNEALIDYSFVTGESEAKLFRQKDQLYAGGKVIGQGVEILVLEKNDAGYFKNLWTSSTEKKGLEDLYRESFVHGISKWFTLILFTIAFVAFIFWWSTSTTLAFNALTTVLIVACPCVLLLSHSYTYGFVMQSLHQAGIHIKNSLVLERLQKINHLVFDKTGTLTSNHKNNISWNGNSLSDEELKKIKSVLMLSTHPKSKFLVEFLASTSAVMVNNFKEVAGCGVEGYAGNDFVKVGKRSYVDPLQTDHKSNSVHVSINGTYKGSFQLRSEMRAGMGDMLKQIKAYPVSVISGDNNSDQPLLEKYVPANTELLFNVLPHDKLNYIKNLQSKGKLVAMVGDGINDSGALAQSQVGISITGSDSNFVPACDVLVEEEQTSKLMGAFRLAKIAHTTILATFAFALVYNSIGLYFAVSGTLTPGIAAILMPLSTFSIVTTAFISIKLSSIKLKLNQKTEPNHVSP